MDLSGVKKKTLLGVKENNKKSSTRAPSPNARTALTRSPRIAVKIKGPLKSRVRRIVAGIRLRRDTVLQVEAEVPGLDPALLPAGAPAPAGVQAVALAPPLPPAALGPPAHPEAPAALPVPRALPCASMTKGGAPAPNPNHLKEMKKRGKGRALHLSPPKCTLEGSPGL
ncbi:RNA-binding protein with serine-rich domain 1 [Lemmus lemmus]